MGTLFNIYAVMVTKLPLTTLGIPVVHLRFCVSYIANACCCQTQKRDGQYIVSNFRLQLV